MANSAACPPTDQIGTPRPQELVCDIGAIELPPTIPTLSEWAQLAMILLLVIGGLVALRPRSGRPPTTGLPASPLSASISTPA